MDSCENDVPGAIGKRKRIIETFPLQRRNMDSEAVSRSKDEAKAAVSRFKLERLLNQGEQEEIDWCESPTKRP